MTGFLAACVADGRGGVCGGAQDPDAAAGVLDHGAGAYAEAARTSLPDAIQVADRFHLWRNLGEAVDKTVRAHHHCLREAPTGAEREPVGEDAAASPPSAAVPLNAHAHPSKLAARTIERHALVQGLIEQGHSMARIAREHGLDPRTAKRFATAEQPDQLLGRSSLLDDYKLYLLERIAAGCAQAITLHAEIQARGWRGSIQTLVVQSSISSASESC